MAKGTLSNLCKLTAANELDIAASNPDFRERYGKALSELFNRMGKNLSARARQHATHVLAPSN